MTSSSACIAQRGQPRPWLSTAGERCTKRPRGAPNRSVTAKEIPPRDPCCNQCRRRRSEQARNTYLLCAAAAAAGTSQSPTVARNRRDGPLCWSARRTDSASVVGAAVGRAPPASRSGSYRRSPGSGVRRVTVASGSRAAATSKTHHRNRRQHGGAVLAVERLHIAESVSPRSNRNREARERRSARPLDRQMSTDAQYKRAGGARGEAEWEEDRTRYQFLGARLSDRCVFVYRSATLPPRLMRLCE